MSSLIRIRYDEEDGTLERRGIETPKGSRVVMHVGENLAAKIPGSHGYGGQGRPSIYHGAKFIVYHVEEAEDGWLYAREILSWPVRS